MKHSAVLVLALSSTVSFAQTTAKPATAPKAAATSHAATVASATKLPPGIPPVHGIVKSAFALRYEDYKVGTGSEAEPNKLYSIKYTGYLAATGQKFDTWENNRQPVRDKDGKVVTGDDGKPKLGDPEPLVFPQGFGRVIPGFDQGFAGMHIGGKRRIFIPWQLAYGTRDIPARGPDHVGIPPKSDLIFDVELVDMKDMPAQQGHMPMGAMPHPGQPIPHPAGAPPAGTPANSAAPAAPATAPKPDATTPPPTEPAQPATPPTSSQPSTPPATSQPATPQPQSKQ